MLRIYRDFIHSNHRILNPRSDDRSPSIFKALGCTVALSALLSLSAQRAEAAPTGFSLVGGGSVEAPVFTNNNKTMTINQRSNRAVIEWTDFNVASDETVNFTVTNALGVADPTGATLNRITGNGISTISGTVSSNGTLYFVNPNGLVFDATSRVTANGFWAGTGTIATSDFMNNPLPADIVDRGTKTVRLDGAITAPSIVAVSNAVSVRGTLTATGNGADFNLKLYSTELTMIGSGAVISASAGGGTPAAKGGNIHIYSQKAVQVLGQITALGGSTSGNGGDVRLETLGFLNFKGTIDNGATSGSGSISGTIIISGGTSGITVSSNGATDLSLGDLSPEATPADPTRPRDRLPSLSDKASGIKASALSELLKKNDVTIIGNGDRITLAAALDWSAATAPHNLTLERAPVFLSANITGKAGSVVTVSGRGSEVNLGSNITVKDIDLKLNITEKYLGGAFTATTNGANIYLAVRGSDANKLGADTGSFAIAAGDGFYFSEFTTGNIHTDPFGLATGLSFSGAGKQIVLLEKVGDANISNLQTSKSVVIKATGTVIAQTVNLTGVVTVSAGSNIDLAGARVSGLANLRAGGGIDLASATISGIATLVAGDWIAVNNSAVTNSGSSLTAAGDLALYGDLRVAPAGLTVTTRNVIIEVPSVKISGGDLRLNFAGTGSGKILSLSVELWANGFWQSTVNYYNQITIDGNLHVTGLASTGHYGSLIISGGSFNNQLVKNEASYTLLKTDLPTFAKPTGLEIHGSYYATLVNSGGTIAVDAINASDLAYPIALRGTAITLSGVNQFGGELRLETTGLGAAGGVTLSGGSLAVVGKLSIAASGLALTGNGVITGATGGVFVNLGSSGLVSGGSVLTMTGQNLYFSGSATGHSATVSLGTGPAAAGRGSFYATKYFKGDHSFALTDLAASTSFGGLTINNPLTTEAAVLTDGIMTVSGITSTGATGITLIGGGIWVKGTASSFASSLSLIAGTIPIIVDLGLATESASPLRIDAALTTTGAGSWMSLRQSGNLSVALGSHPSFGQGYSDQLPPLPTNQLAGLMLSADLTAGGEISFEQSGSLSYGLGWDRSSDKVTGNVTNIPYSSANLFGIKNQNSNLRANGGGITLTASTNQLSWSGNLTSSGAMAVTANIVRLNGTFLASQGGFAVTASSGVLSGSITASQGGIALAIQNATLSGSLAAGGGATISLTGTDLWLADTVTSSGAAVTITLTGAYDNRVLNSAGGLEWGQTGRLWTTTNKNMTFSAGSVRTGTRTLVDVGTAVFSSSNFSFLDYFGTNIYVTNQAGITNTTTLRAALTAASATDHTAEFVSLDQFSQGKVFNDVFTAKTGSVSFGSFRHFVGDSAKVTFWNLTRGEINRPLTASSFVFAGTSNSFTHGLILKTAGTVAVNTALEVRGGELTITATGTISFGSTLTVNGKVDRVRPEDTTAVLDSGLRLYSDGTVSFADNVTLENGDLYLWAKTSVSMVAGKSIATNGNHAFLGNAIPTLTNLQLNLTGFAADGTTATDGKFYFTAFSAGDANGNTNMSTVTLPSIPASNPSGLTFALRTPTKHKAVVATGVLTVSGYSSTVTDSLWLEGKGLILSGTNSFAGDVYLVASGAPLNGGTVEAPVPVAIQASGTTTVSNGRSLNFITLLHLDNGISKSTDLYDVAGGKLVIRDATFTASQINLGVDRHANSIGSLLIDSSSGGSGNVFNGAVNVKTLGWDFMAAWEHQIRDTNLAYAGFESKLSYNPKDGGAVKIAGTNSFNLGLTVLTGNGSRNYAYISSANSVSPLENSWGGNGGEIVIEGTNRFSSSAGISLSSGHGGFGSDAQRGNSFSLPLYGIAEGGVISLGGTMTVASSVTVTVGTNAGNFKSIGVAIYGDYAVKGAPILLTSGFELSTVQKNIRLNLRSGIGASFLNTNNSISLRPHGDIAVYGVVNLRGVTAYIDVGTVGGFEGGKIVGGGTLNTNNGDLRFFTALDTNGVIGSLAGNNAVINVGSGRFIFAKNGGASGTINSTTSFPAGFEFNLATPTVNAGVSTFVRSGLGIATTGGINNVNNAGLVYTGAVTVDGVVNGALTYIEGANIAVTGTASSFANGLTLVSTGAGVTVGAVTAGIYVGATITVATGDLNLLQYGTVAGHGIFVASAANLTATTGSVLLSQLGSSDASNPGIVLSGSDITAGGNINLLQLGGNLHSDGIRLGTSSMTAGGAGREIRLRTSGANLSLTGGDVTLVGAGDRVTVDLGATGKLLGSTPRLVASGLTVNFDGSLSGHSSSIKIDGGNFRFVSDHSDITETVTLDGNLLNTDATKGWKLGFSSWTVASGGFAAGGLTVITSRNLAEISLFGVRFGGVVQLSGIGTGAGNLKNLSYIEGAGIKTVGNESVFTGSLTLFSSATSVARPGVSFDDSEPNRTAGIIIASSLRTGTENDGSSNLTLLRKLGAAGRGIFVNSNVTAGGNLLIDLGVETSFEGVYFKNATVKSGGTITVIQSGNYSSFGIKLEDTTVTARSSLRLSSAGGATISGNISVLGSSLTATTGDLLLEQSGTGTAQGTGIHLNSGVSGSSHLRSNGGQVSLRQTGNSLGKGIVLQGTSINAALDINLVSSGSLTAGPDGNSLAFDVDLDTNHAVTAGGANRRSVIFQTTNQDLKVTNLTVADAQLRILLGTGKISGSGTIHAEGLTTFYAAAKTGSDTTIHVGKGRFLFITNNGQTTASSLTATTTIDKTGLAWDSGVAPVETGLQLTSGTLRLITQGGDSSVKGVGAVFAGDIVLNGITAASDIGNLAYLEAKSIVAKTSASVFAGRVTLVSTGQGTDGSITAGINFSVRVSTGVAGDGTSDLQLVNIGTSSGYGIYLSGSVGAGGQLSLLTIGTSTLDGISLNNASLSAGRDILLEANGTVVNSTAAGIALNGSLFKGSGLLTGLVTIKTANQNLKVTSSQAVANIVQQARLRIDLGSGYSKGGGALTAAGLNLYYTGGLTPDGSNWVSFDIGSGSFVLVADRRAAGAAISLDSNSSATTAGLGWGSGLGLSGSGTLDATGVRTFTSSSGIELKTSGGLRNLNGMGVVYDAAVTISGVGGAGGSGTADDLRYIEARSITVSGAASFNGSLTLVATGAEVSGVKVASGATLVTKTTADGLGELVLVQQGGATQQQFGIELAAGAAITAAGKFSLVQRGVSSNAGIKIDEAAITAGGTIEFNQIGTVSSDTGILFNATANQTLVAGSGGKGWVIFRTGNRNFSVNGSDLAVSDSRLLLSLGTGNLTGGQTVISNGGDVYFAGGSSNAANIDIGSGSFSFVTDRSGSTDAVSLTSTTAANDTTVGWNSTGLNFVGQTGGGLSIVKTGGAFTAADQRFAVIYGGAVTIQAASAAVWTLNTIIGASISVTAANSFSGDITLLTGGGDFSSTAALTGDRGMRIITNGGRLTSSGGLTATTGVLSLNSGGGLISLSSGVTASADSIAIASGGGAVSLGGNLTSNSAAASSIAITSGGGGLTLTANVTTTNGVVTLDLGTGSYSQDAIAGYSFTSNNKSLSLTAGSVVAKNSATVFALGTGSFTLTATTPGSSLVSTSIGSEETRYDGGFVNSGNEARITSATAVYYFTTKSGAEFSTLSTAITAADANGVLLDISALSQAGWSLGKKVVTPAGQTTGFSGGTGTTGNISWSSSSTAPTETAFSLKTGRVLHFRDVTNSAFNDLTLGNAGIVFDGSNSFTLGLNLTTSGSISQSSGATLTVSGGNLSMTAGVVSGVGIALTQTGNDLGTLGVISSVGTVSITNSAGNLSLGGNISVTTAVVAGTAITITAVNRDLTLTADVATSGGAVVLDLGTGTYGNGTRKLTTGSKNLTLTAGDIGNKESTAIFDLGSGTLSVGAAGVKLSTKDTNAQRTEYDPAGLIKDDTNRAINSNPAVVYYLTSDTGTALDANKAAVGNPNTSLWLNPSALNAGNLGTYTAIPANRVTQVGFSTNSGVIGWTKDNHPPAVTIRFAAGRPLHFYKVSNFALTAATLPVSFGAIEFHGVNSFVGNLTLSNSGQISQSLLNNDAAITLTNGSLTLAAGGSITLDATNNSFGSLASVTTSSGAITLKNNGTLSVLTLSSSDGAISLTNAGRLTIGGTVSSKSSGTGLSTGITITTTGADSHLTLSSTTTASGGKLTLNLGGNYNPNDFQWDLTNNELSLTAAAWGGASTTTVAFNNVGAFTALGGMVPRLEGGKAYTETRDEPKAKWSEVGGVDYFTTLSYGSDAYSRAEAELLATDPQARLHPWSDLTVGATKTYFAKIEKLGTSVQWTASRTEVDTSGALSLTKVGFYNVRRSSLELQNLTGVTEISFAGVNQLSAGLDLSTNASLTRLRFADNASLRGGDLTLNSALMGGGLMVGNNAALPTLKATSTATVLVLNLGGDFVQQAGSAITNPVKIVPGRNSGPVTVILNSPNNDITNISGDTQGGSVTVVTRGSIKLNAADGTGLNSWGGSVAIRAGGSITATDLQVGMVSFQAGGAVNLGGSFVGARGSGSSVSLNNRSVVLVLGDVWSDSNLVVDGLGSVILSGTLAGAGSVAIARPVVVVGSAEIVSSGGRISLAGDVNAIAASVVAGQASLVHSLRLLSGNNGTISFGATGGTRLALGWVEFQAGAIVNPGGYTLSLLSGRSLIPTTGLLDPDHRLSAR